MLSLAMPKIEVVNDEHKGVSIMLTPFSASPEALQAVLSAIRPSGGYQSTPTAGAPSGGFCGLLWPSGSVSPSTA